MKTYIIQIYSAYIVYINLFHFYRTPFCKNESLIMEKDGIVDHSGIVKETLFNRIKKIYSSCPHDITIRCSDGEIKTNKLMLRILSEKLEKIIHHAEKTGENYFKICHSKEVVTAILTFLVSGVIDLNKLQLTELIDLMVLSRGTFDKPTLAEDTQPFLLRKLKVSSAVEKLHVLKIAQKHSLEFLADKILAKFELEFFVDTEAISKLDFSSAKKLFTGNATSIERLTAFHAWIQANPYFKNTEFRSDIAEVVKTFDVKQFSKKDILGVVKESGFYSSDEMLNMMSNIIEGLQATCSSLKREGEYMEEEDIKPSSPKKLTLEEPKEVDQNLNPKMDKALYIPTPELEPESEGIQNTLMNPEQEITPKHSHEDVKKSPRNIPNEITWKGALEWVDKKDGDCINHRISYKIRCGLYRVKNLPSTLTVKFIPPNFEAGVGICLPYLGPSRSKEVVFRPQESHKALTDRMRVGGRHFGVVLLPSNCDIQVMILWYNYGKLYGKIPIDQPSFVKTIKKALDDLDEINEDTPLNKENTGRNRVEVLTENKDKHTQNTVSKQKSEQHNIARVPLSTLDSTESQHPVQGKRKREYIEEKENIIQRPLKKHLPEKDLVELSSTVSKGVGRETVASLSSEEQQDKQKRISDQAGCSRMSPHLVPKVQKKYNKNKSPKFHGENTWEGELEWTEKDEDYTNRRISFNIRSRLRSVNLQFLPSIMIINLVPHGCLFGLWSYKKPHKSKAVVFRPQESDKELTDKMRNNYGVILLPSNWYIQGMLLWYNEGEDKLIGYIPNDQSSFVEKVAPVVEKFRQLHGIKQEPESRECVWSGVIEWRDNFTHATTGEEVRETRSLSFKLSCIRDTVTGLPEIRSHFWPDKILIQFLPISIIESCLHQYKTVFLDHDRNNFQSHIGLSMRLFGSVGYAKVNFTAGESRVLLLFDGKAPNTGYCGAVPVDPTAFADRIEKAVSDHKKRYTIKQ